MLEFLKQPWPWYISGVVIGLMVPVLLIAGNKSFGISANLRHICAACFPARISFFKYNWKKEIWNLFFAAGIIAGGFIAAHFLANPNPVQVNAADLFASQRFSQLIETLRPRYDHIVIDTPPVLFVPDARVIAPLADAVVYAVQWGRTSRAQVAEGVRLLTSIGIAVTGLALTRIPLKSQEIRRYGGQGYFDEAA